MLKSSLRIFWYKLSPKSRFLIRRALYWPIDFIDLITGNRRKYVPPRGMIYTGRPCSPKQFIQEGEEQLNFLKDQIKLTTTDFILDIGSGIGRTAIPLSHFLSPEARYEGFDVVKLGVDWCNKKIKPQFLNFGFTYVALSNDLYNDSEKKAATFKFPYQENYFDKVFSFSVFTHMQIEEISHYLGEIYRVLKPGGLSLNTFFLYDAETENALTKDATFSFPFKKQGYSLMDEKTKSGNIAIEISFLKSMAAEKKLELVSITHGFWKEYSIKKYNSQYQDMVVFKKASTH